MAFSGVQKSSARPVTPFLRGSEAALLRLLNAGKIGTKGDTDQHGEAVARVNV